MLSNLLTIFMTFLFAAAGTPKTNPWFPLAHNYGYSDCTTVDEAYRTIDYCGLPSHACDYCDHKAEDNCFEACCQDTCDKQEGCEFAVVDRLLNICTLKSMKSVKGSLAINMDADSYDHHYCGDEDATTQYLPSCESSFIRRACWSEIGDAHIVTWMTSDTWNTLLPFVDCSTSTNNPSGNTTTKSHTTSPLFRNKVYGWMSCEDIEDTNRSPKRCGVPVNFGNDGPNEHSFVTACETPDAFDSVVETCKTHCLQYNESDKPNGNNHTCDFYSVVKNKHGCTCTLKNTYTLEFATRIHKNTDWTVNMMLWFCDATKFDDSRYNMEDNRLVDGQGHCVYDLDDYSPESGGTWAIDVKYWDEYDSCISDATKCRHVDE